MAEVITEADLWSMPTCDLRELARTVFSTFPVDRENVRIIGGVAFERLQQSLGEDAHNLAGLFEESEVVLTNADGVGQQG